MTSDHLFPHHPRRQFLRQCVGSALGASLAPWFLQPARAQQAVDGGPLAPRDSHFDQRAKNVIFLFMAGGPSQLDLYDPKPALKEWHGKQLPASLTKDRTFSFVKPTAKVWASGRTFKPHGECGTEFSDWVPHIGSVADDLCLVRSMYGDSFNHHPAQSLLMSGSPNFGRPSMGSWVTYGLGSDSRDLPGFVVLSSGVGTDAGTNNWSSGFLPSTYAGVAFLPAKDPILYLGNPAGISRQTQAATIAGLRDLNRRHFEQVGDAEILARNEAYDLAFRMQAAAPEIMDISAEPEHVRQMYGVDQIADARFAANCLLARRMVERGVRFVMINHASWDSHSSLTKEHRKLCRTTDQPSAALIKDLKQRGMLDDTLVIWGGEFGRTPLAEIRRPKEADSVGRDHQPHAFSMWLAGGGIKGGQVIGETDEFGMSVVEDRVHVHDLQATALHCLGLDHTRLTHRHKGRDFRLTDVAGEVVKKMLA